MTNSRAKTQYYLPLLVMLIASVAAMVLRPTYHLADDREKVELEEMVPEQFGSWKVRKQSAGHIVNPEVKQRLEALYSQTLSRTYVNDAGDFIMLSIAYGADQSDAKQLHYPEVCYPSQGFQIKTAKPSILKTDFGDIKVKHLHALMGTRSEPITYWTTVGDKVVMQGRETKLEKLKYGFNGQIPDGLLFRISSIDNNPESAYVVHQNFINEFVSSLPASSRLRLAGLAS